MVRRLASGAHCPAVEEAPMSRAAVETAVAPESVRQVLQTPGEPLPESVAASVGAGAAHHLAEIRVHADGAAARSAAQVGAAAYTVGRHVVFGAGRFRPYAIEGRELLAHELAHAAQQGLAEPGGPIRMAKPGGAADRDADRAAATVRNGGVMPAPAERTAPVLQRKGLYDDIKEAAYAGLISGLRAAKRLHLGLLRKMADALPDGFRRFGEAITDVVDVVDDILIGIVLGTIGIVVGFGEGVADLVMGIYTLVMGILKGLYAATVSLLTWDATKTKEWWNDLLATLKAIPAGLKALVKGWLDQFEKAGPERQALMIGELGGQILAIIASFYVAPSRAGTAGTLATRGEVAATTTARAGLRVIEGGGETSARVAAVTGGEGGTAARLGAEGNAALKAVPEVAPVVEPVVRPVPTLVPPLPAEAGAAAPAVAGPSKTATTAAAGAANANKVAQKAAAKGEEEDDDKRPPTMRHQIQQGLNTHYSSEPVTAANRRIGVTALELRNAMSRNFEHFMRIARGEEKPPPS
jgi:hypothetical protein